MPETRSIRRVAATSLASASIEWYDFFIYGTAAALVFPTVFFPAGHAARSSALIASFSTFAVGFFARPVGGILFGHFGDRLGRKRVLVIALLIMGAGTTLIGCPADLRDGRAARADPADRLALRAGARDRRAMGRCHAVGDGVARPSHKRGLYGSFAQAGAPVGVILANLAFLLVNDNVSQDGFMAWGWRIPFLLSIALIGLSIYVQLRLEETPAFTQLVHADAPYRARQEGPQRVSGVRSAAPLSEGDRARGRRVHGGTGDFLHPHHVGHRVRHQPGWVSICRAARCSPACMIGAVAMAPALLISGVISDRYGRRGIYMAGAALLGLWAFAIFPLIDTGSLLWIGVAIGVGQVFVAMMYGPQAAFLAEMFSTGVRYSGASLGYQFGAIFGGALAPIIATQLLATYGSTIGDFLVHRGGMRDHARIGFDAARDARCRPARRTSVARRRMKPTSMEKNR